MPFHWPLGIFFSYDSDKMNELNFAEKMRNFENTMNSLKRGNPTLHGTEYSTQCPNGLLSNKGKMLTRKGSA